jgi:hypothetical protein
MGGFKLIDTRKNKKNLYGVLTLMDDLTILKPLLKEKNFRVGVDGRLRRSYGAQTETPWIHQHHEEIQKCELWHELFFSFNVMVPTYCQRCWKVVLSIPTVEDLFEVYEIQKELGLPCKCGMELRWTDERRYGGYFYNWGEEAGQECYKIVRKAMPKQIGIILKCACSEYEVACGPPADWVPTERQLEIEAVYERRVTTNETKFRQMDYLKANIMLKWLHHAAHIGDLTYKKFTGDKPLVVKMKTYHKEKKNG